ncbi:hypothetical protein AWC04_02750 [Mycolicibacterium fallax]|uniref:Uncharacterized protein n=1 Tax=Mycolicibacterium fallax TaxID=1793 RepID=A0A1X1RJ85_MYCFA|nr:hypothetical protein AWC04_02750 [Mycolicibacterium fallax]BBY99314.1 hypothetical protein MFAL_27810 [Mycolicibacterium fallax]
MAGGAPQYRSVMADVTLQHQLDEVRALLKRALALFGAEPVEPPADVVPDPAAVQSWARQY